METAPISASLMNRLKQAAQEKNTSVEALLEAFLEREVPAPPPPLQALLLAADGVVAVDKAQRIIAFNPSAEAIFGYQRQEILQQPLDMLIPNGAIGIHTQHMQTFAESSATSQHMSNRRKVQGKRKDGTLFPMEASILEYTHAGKPYYAAILRDISIREQAEAEALARKTILETLAENATDLIALHEPDGTYTYVSPSCRAIGGYEPEELVGKNPYDHFHPDDLDAIKNSHDTALNRQGKPIVTYRYRRKDGEYIWMETVTNPVVDDSGNVISLVTVTRDITERREFEEAIKAERDLLEQIMQTSPSGISVVDRDGQIIFANDRAEEILGVPESEIINRKFDAPTWKHTNYDGTPFPDEKQPFVQVMNTKEPVWEVRHAIEWSDGKKVYLSINGAPILDDNGEVSKVVFTVEDYTERQRQQDKLKAALERERKANEMKSSFLSMVSHEFRTPMAVIMTSTGIMRMKQGKMPADEIKRRLRQIEQQVERLTVLVDDVTVINKEDLLGRDVQLEPTDINNLFKDMVQDVEFAYPMHVPIKLIKERPFTGQLMVDPVLYRQIFSNLLTNAMKYSPPTSSVTFSYLCDGKTFTGLVTDGGIGIPEKDQKQLFEIFHRASNVGAIAGTGLGLVIVKRAVNALGGTITFESAENVGSKFLVTLPVTMAEVQPPHNTQQPQTNRA